MNSKTKTTNPNPGGKATVSLATVAERAAVSKMTASRVLRDSSGFSEETRKRVWAACKELGYVPNKLAAAFGSDKANTLVGIAVPTIGRDLFSQILEGVESKLSSVGYQPIVGVVGYDDAAELQWLSSVLAWRPAGLIIAGRERGKKIQTLLANLQIPIVEIWSLNARPNDISVGFNHYAAGQEMGEYLKARYSGLFGYVGARVENIVLGNERLKGFSDALAPLSRREGGELQTHFLNDRSSFYAGYYGTEQLLSRQPDIRAIYYLDDNMAFGGLMLCQAKGIKVPGDIAIAGFGGMEIGAVLQQSLTTTNTFRLRIGKMAADCLLKRVMEKSITPVQDVGFELIAGDTA